MKARGPPGPPLQGDSEKIAVVGVIARSLPRARPDSIVGHVHDVVGVHLVRSPCPRRTFASPIVERSTTLALLRCRAVSGHGDTACARRRFRSRRAPDAFTFPLSPDGSRRRTHLSILRATPRGRALRTATRLPAGRETKTTAEIAVVPFVISHPCARSLSAHRLHQQFELTLLARIGLFRRRRHQSGSGARVAAVDGGAS